MLTEHVIKLDEHVFIVTLLVKQSSQFFLMEVFYLEAEMKN